MELIKVYPNRKVYISALITGKASVIVLAKYLNFANVFSKKFAALLPEYTEINTYTIDLEQDKQLLYGPIYSLDTVELETPKTYIKTHLANDFIHLFKFPTVALILFDKKFDKSP